MRSMILSNGELCVALDQFGLVRDLYYPHVGLEDHVRGHYVHRVGVYVNGRLSWLGEDSGWHITITCEEEALASAITARHAELQLELFFTDIVYNERAIFLRRVRVSNLSSDSREIKLYFAHQFEIGKSHGGDTGYYDPALHCIVHYKGRRVFLINAMLDDQPFDDFAIGLANVRNLEGSHRDAEDGQLSQNPIEHGAADSIIGLYAPYAAGQSREAHYWLAAAQSIPDAHVLNEYCLTKTPAHLIRSASDYWRAWVNAYEWSFYGLSEAQISLFKLSLMYVRAHVDNEGGIVASVDSDMLHYGYDTYSYVWPRDGAYAAMALDKAGDTNVARRFLEFCKSVVSPDGYLMHKYLPDRSLGSSWHPWFKDGKFQLPIQEDETAIVIIALREHYANTRDLEFLEQMFNALVETTANFMVEYRDSETKLPQPTYDAWEEKRGSSTYTSASVYGALQAAADLARILGKKRHEERYRAAAEEIKAAILTHLWDEEQGVFLKMVNCDENGCEADRTLDMSSVYGIFFFEVLPHDDPKLASAFEKTVHALSEGVPTGGLGRYVGDQYYREESQSAGNPWINTTLWHAEYLIANAKSEQDLAPVKAIFEWTVQHALSSGILAEQVHPVTGAPISAAPLAWSHAAYVTAVLKYLDKIEELGICPACNQVAIKIHVK